MSVKRKKKSKKTIIRNVIFNTITLISLYFIVISLIEIPKVFALIREYNKLEAQYNSAEEELQELTLQKTKLEDEEYVMVFARGKYLFSDKNEKVFHLPAKED